MVKRALLFIMCFMVVIGFSACSEKTVEGAWYSVTDGTMYSFEGGEISKAGNVVGQYVNENDYIVVCFSENGENKKLYIASAYETDVLSNSSDNGGSVYFCRGFENVERIMQEREKELKDFYDSLCKLSYSRISGMWEAVDSDAPYKSIDISMFLHHLDLYHADFSPKKGTCIPVNIVTNDDRTEKVRLEMVDRGYDSPTAYLSTDLGQTLEFWVDKSLGSEGELVLEFHTATYTEKYLKSDS